MMKNEVVAAAEEEVEINAATITTHQHRPKRTTIQINLSLSHPINNNPVKTPIAPQNHHPRITTITINKNSRTKAALIMAAITHRRINPLQVISHSKTRRHLKRHQRLHKIKMINQRLVKITKRRKTNRG